MTILSHPDVIKAIDYERELCQRKINRANDEAWEAIRAEREEHEREIKGKIILDPDKDPDPYGNFGISLVDRLRAMGWPE